VPGSGPYGDDEMCRGFVENLLRLRKAYGWTQEKLAAEALLGKGVIANIEAFHRPPLIEHGEAIDGALGLTDVFAGKARAMRGETFPPAFRSFTEYEARATDLFIFEHSTVPGLFQTERYAMATLARHPNTNEDTVKERAAGRLARQRILTRDEPPPPRVWALLDESVLHRSVGDAEIMREQLARLLALSDLPHVTIQVLEGLEVHVGVLGAFTIAEWPGHAGIVNLEHIADGQVSDESAKVEHVRLIFRAMQTEALHTRASRDLIARMAEETWKERTPTGVRALTAAPMGGSA